MKKAALPCAAFYALYYGVNAVYMGYISKYYQQQGISHGALTLLLLCFPVLSMFSLPFWGARSDGSGRPRVILQGVILLSALLMPFLAGGHLLFACAALACCYPAIQPLGDSLILHSLQKNGQPFGPVRLVGSLAFSAVNLLFGYLLRDEYSAVPWTVCAGLGGLLAVSFLLPKEKESRREKGSFREVLEKVKNEKDPIRFSRHAVNRLNTRGIDMTPEQVSRLEGARNQAKDKGINDTLILLDDMAFIVNVPNNTVVTAMDREEGENSIFTNIDGAVIA